MKVFLFWCLWMQKILICFYFFSEWNMESLWKLSIYYHWRGFFVSTFDRNSIICDRICRKVTFSQRKGMPISICNIFWVIMCYLCWITCKANSRPANIIVKIVIIMLIAKIRRFSSSISFALFFMKKCFIIGEV